MRPERLTSKHRPNDLVRLLGGWEKCWLVGEHHSYCMLMQAGKKTALVALLVFDLLANAAATKSASGSIPFRGPATTINTADLRGEVNAFLAQELGAHLGDIKTLEPPPQRVVGTPTTGEFSWGTFMYALARYANTTGQSELAGRDLARWIGKLGLIDARSGAKTFSQLYAALSLRNFGTDLGTNPLWQSLTADEQTAWRSLLNPERFYDPRADRVINLPENYFGVAARLAAIDYQLGINSDRAYVGKLLDRAAIQFTSGALYSDDAPPTGRYDRYSNEYARYLYEAAETAGRKDLLEKLRPSLKRQMQLWWDIVAEDGYGYNWGRSQGVVSYLDTPEIAGFLGAHPEFRPAALTDIAAVYYRAWRYLRSDYNDKAHLLSLFAFGRGNYAYITREREWQQTTSFFGKLGNSHTTLMNALEREGISSFPAVANLPAVARFEFFRQSGERQAGVWVVRQGPLRFALPITTGTKPGVADYLPAPHGLPGFAAPVEQTYPSFVPYLELEDGRTIVAADGADEIEPAADGRSLLVRWKRWAIVGGKAGELVDPGLSTAVVWRIAGNTLIRDETVTSVRPIKVRRWRLAVPTSFAQVETSWSSNNARTDLFTAPAGELQVKLQGAHFPVTTSVMATGDGPLGRGVRGHIPLHLIFAADNFVVQPDRPLRFILTTAVSANKPSD